MTAVKSVTIRIVPGEKKLIDEFDALKIPYELSPLDVGDVHIISGDTVEVIIERKEGKDLEASIKDGRYEEQKLRLKSLISPTFSERRIVYLIENLPKTSNIKKSLWSAITNMYQRDGFTVFQTKNLLESAEYISSLAASISKYSELTPSTVPSELKITETQIKKRKVSPEDFFLNTLMLIPGVNEVATCIVEKYPSMSSLKLAFNCENPGSVLKDLIRKNGRKVGPVISERIYDYFKNQ